MTNEKTEAVVTLKKTSDTEEAVKAEDTVAAKGEKTKLRKFPLWLRVILFILAVLVVIVIGVLIGYSVLGGGSAADVFKVETWTHIFDIMNGKE